MNRRSLIQYAPAAGMAALMMGAVPVIAQAQADTPVAAAYREWAAFADMVRNSPSDMDDKLFDALCSERHDMELSLFALPAQNTDDVLLKLLAYSDKAQDFATDGNDTPETILREGMKLMGVAA